jgi:hypothetical protein
VLGCSLVMALPSRQDINVYDSLDERSACEHFLGKSLDEAEALFRENWLYYQEDLMFMGIGAFRFYVQAAIRYIQSESATGDSSIVSCFAMILESRLEHESVALVSIADQLASICGCILEQHERFDFTPETLDDDPVRVQTLQQTLLGLQARFTLLSNE